MIGIIVSCHAQTHRIFYGDDRALAETELAKLLPLIGRDRRGKNGKEEEPTHTILSPLGNVTVVLEKVEVARLIDADAEYAMIASLLQKEEKRKFTRELEWRNRLVDAGFLTKKGATAAPLSE